EIASAPLFHLSGRGVVEGRVGAVAVQGFAVVPLQRCVVAVLVRSAGEHVEVRIGVVVEMKRGGRKQVGHLAAVLERAVGHVGVAAAVVAVVPAVCVDNAALVVARQRIAGGLAGV